MIFEVNVWTDFLPISNLIFAGYTDSKNQSCYRQKIKLKNQIQISISWIRDFKNQMQINRGISWWKLSNKFESQLHVFRINFSIFTTGILCWNPAFDVTLADLITGGIITEKGVVKAPLDSLENLKTLELTLPAYFLNKWRKEEKEEIIAYQRTTSFAEYNWTIGIICWI